MIGSHPLLENVQYFISDILGGTFGNYDWSTNRVQEAYRWAGYVEMAYDKQRLAGDADELVDFILKNNPKYIRGEIEEILKDPISSLNKLLLQNPYLSDDMFEEILKINSEGTTLKDNFKKDLWIVSRNRDIVVNLFNGAKVIGFDLCDHTLVSRLLEDRTSDHISDAVIAHIVTRSLDTQDSLRFLLDTMMSLHHSASDSKALPGLSRAHERLKLLTEKLTEECFAESKRKILLAQDPKKLANLASISFAFFKKFVNLLGEETESLERDSDNLAQPTWKSKSSGMQYLDLVIFWRHLLNADRRVAEITNGWLVDFRRNSDNLVWDSLILAIS